MTQIIEAENIKCSGCTNSITKALMKIEGIENVAIDISAETITINGTADNAIIIDTLSKLGYPKKGNNNLLKKTKSYVNCALGKIN